jgi:hypothetical protein
MVAFVEYVAAAAFLVGVIGSSAWVVASSASRRLSLRGGAVKRAHEAELVALQGG